MIIYGELINTRLFSSQNRLCDNNLNMKCVQINYMVNWIQNVAVFN